MKKIQAVRIEKRGTGKDKATVEIPIAGVFYRIGQRIGGTGEERIYYLTYKKDGKKIETKVGRQYADQMTPAKAANIRKDLIEGREVTRKEKREAVKKAKAEDAARYTIDRLWETYSEQRTHNLNYHKDRVRYETYLKPHFGKKEVPDIYPLDIDRVRLKYLKTHSPQTTKHILALLKRLVNFGMKRGLCPALPFPIEMPKVDNIKDDALTEQQLQSLVNAIQKDDHPQAGPLMLIALFTGMRRGELFNLKWSDIDFDRGFINIRDPKGGKDKTIPLNDQAREVFESHPRTRSEYVFPGKGGKKRTNAQKSINKIKAAAGLPDHIRPLHSLRHTFASMAISSGEIDLYTLQKLTTHKTPAMLQRYAHLADKRLKEGGNAAGNAVANAMKPNAEIKKIS
ncbi:MAG: site-specific integrase [Pseudomonadota bacterium]